MNPISSSMKYVVAFASVLFITTSLADAADQVLPKIAIKDAPLLEAIQLLARQAKMNIILDPHIPGACCGAAFSQDDPTIAGTWENTTSHDALTALLKEHKLIIVTNAATTVARIAPIDLNVKPVPASAVGVNNSPAIPLLMLEDVPLSQAIVSIAKTVGLEATVDPKALETISKGTASIRWEKITGRQALAAICDNYSLTMTEDPAKSTATITLK